MHTRTLTVTDPLETKSMPSVATILSRPFESLLCDGIGGDNHERLNMIDCYRAQRSPHPNILIFPQSHVSLVSFDLHTCSIRVLVSLKNENSKCTTHTDPSSRSRPDPLPKVDQPYLHVTQCMDRTITRHLQYASCDGKQNGVTRKSKKS